MIRFTKAQTNGNDFIIIEGNESILSLDQKKLIANRNFGVGCDQLIFVKRVDQEYSVDIFNQDGSHADMCGNGACAVSLYIEQKYHDKSPRLTISKTIYKTELCPSGIKISVPLPQRTGNLVTTGNKHLIFDITLAKDAESLAKENSDCNLHFIDNTISKSIKMKTFERGVGWTLACGSGAIAVGFASGESGQIEIIHDGGTSLVELKEDHVNLITNPKIVFEGEFYG